MANFHVNYSNGVTSECSAQVRCPFGSINYHYGSMEDAQKAYEIFGSGMLDSSKSVSFGFTTDSERHMYTNADCAHLARELHNKTGFPIFFLGDSTDSGVPVGDRRWSHFVVRVPDGRFMDVEGVWTKDELIKRWGVDPLGQGWMPNDVLPADKSDFRKMGVAGRMFEDKLSITSKKILNAVNDYF